MNRNWKLLTPAFRRKFVPAGLRPANFRLNGGAIILESGIARQLFWPLQPGIISLHPKLVCRFYYNA